MKAHILIVLSMLFMMSSCGPDGSKFVGNWREPDHPDTYLKIEKQDRNFLITKHSVWQENNLSGAGDYKDSYPPEGVYQLDKDENLVMSGLFTFARDSKTDQIIFTRGSLRRMHRMNIKDMDSMMARVYIEKGLGRFQLKQPDSAVVYLNKAREVNSKYPKLDEMYYNVGVNFYIDKRYPEAVNCWRTCLGINPEFAQAKNAMEVLKQKGLLK